MAVLDMQHISLAFHPDPASETVVFRDFSFSVEEGSFVSVVGSNGSGKTTLLNLIAGALTPDDGRVFLSGRDITAWPEHRRAARIARVFQDPARGVAGRMTVAENLALAAAKGGRYDLRPALAREDGERFRALLAPLGLGLEDKLTTPAGALSGGQRQVLSLLMATMTEADLLLLDEHTAALDPKTADMVMALTDRLVRERGLSALMVTHNLRYATEYGDRLVMLHGGESVLDVRGDEKRATGVPDVLDLFNRISVECGN